MDSLTKEHRSWNMSRIRAKDTKPELVVRSILHGMGYRFRLNNTVLPGRPDIVLPRYRVVVFVHGCFWHRHEGCRYAYTPKSRIDFWQHKFELNIRRDKQVAVQLEELKWGQLVLWECEIKNPEDLKRRIKTYFCDR
jgi:DNA mismatch endonuclease (patch repair protein)